MPNVCSIFNPGELLPSGLSSVLGEFRIYPEEDIGSPYAGMLNTNNQIASRVKTRSPTNTQIQILISPVPAFGASSVGLGRTAGRVNLASTSAASIKSLMYPFFRVWRSGNDFTGVEELRLVIAFAFKVDKVVCTFGQSGMPWVVGEDLMKRSLA